MKEFYEGDCNEHVLDLPKSKYGFALTYPKDDCPWCRIVALQAQLAAFRDALPDPDKLDLLAKMFDVALPNDPNPEIQTTLRTWAAKIRALAATEPVGLRARAAAKGVTLATPPDSQREIDLRTGKRMGPEPVEGGGE